MRAHSLKTRLLVIGTIVLIIALGLTGFGLTLLFDRHVERRVSAELDTYLAQIASRLSFDETGKPHLGGKLADPRFEKIYGGLYWQVNNETAGLSASSRSLWDTRLKLPVDIPGFGKVHVHTTTGPQNSSVLIHERRLRFKSPAGEQIARLIVAIDRAELDRMSADFASDVAIALLALCIFLLLAGWAQISFGLGPLTLIRKNIAAIRTGKTSRIPLDLPAEVLPLAKEVNDLLRAQEAAIENAKHRASDLAHGFKTPLTALKSDIRRLRDKGEHNIADDIEATSLLMQRQIDRELTKARLRNIKNMPATRILPLIEGIIATLQRTPEGEGKSFEIECDPDIQVLADKDDVAEILGNLIENAVKHAADRIAVKVNARVRDVMFTIDDDGGGISDSQRRMAVKRGVRLDSSIVGSGLGLAIVKDVLEAYGQHLELETSPLGGLKAAFQLPQAAGR